jgi:DNA polymerase-3 subunit beta
MKLKIAKEELLKRLSDIQSIVSKKSTMPILGYFLLSVGEENYIIATDLDTAIKEPIEITEVEEGGELCIPAKKLYEIVREVEGDLVLDSDGSEWLRLTSDSSSFRLACMSSDEFPRWPEIQDPVTIELDASQLNNMIARTLYAAGESDTRYTLNSLLFHIKPEGTLTVVGTDGHRLSMVKQEIPVSTDKEMKILIPRKSASELKKFLVEDEEKVNMQIGTNHVSFSIGDVLFLVRLIEGNYPGYEQAIPYQNEKKVVINREEFIKVLRRVSVMSRERQSAVKLDLKDGSMILNSSSPDVGEARDEIEVTYTGDDISLGFNARYLLDALSAMASERVIFEIQEPLSATLLKEEGNDNYLCVIMPMRI